jgi:hypothetical protein
MNPKEIFGNVLSNKWQKLKDMTATTLWGYGIKEGKKTTTIEWEYHWNIRTTHQSCRFVEVVKLFRITVMLLDHQGRNLHLPAKCWCNNHGQPRFCPMLI